jgi:hypothetical protein
MIKLVYCVRRRDDVSQSEFHDYWLNTHGPKVRSVAKEIHALRYVQSHRTDSQTNDALRAVRNMSEPYDGITEVWFRDEAHMNQASGTQEGRAAGAFLVEDEARFIDMEKSCLFVTQEHEIFDLS